MFSNKKYIQIALTLILKHIRITFSLKKKKKIFFDNFEAKQIISSYPSRRRSPLCCYKALPTITVEQHNRCLQQQQQQQQQPHTHTHIYRGDDMMPASFGPPKLLTSAGWDSNPANNF